VARAYASAVKEAVAVADIIKYEKEYFYEFETSYSDVSKKEYLLKTLGIEQVTRDFLADKVVWKIITNEKKLNSFKEQECTR
jgi:putative IMPACT (imprinted ancient) family translation regulator